jgi:hypothetical protein
LGNKGVWRRSLSEISTIENYNTEEIPTDYSISQNYPNPFNPTTTIRYQIPQAGFVSLKIYDVLGREVATLVNEEKLSGEYSAVFEGSNLSSGIYFYKLQAENFYSIKKMILIK